MAVYLLRYNEPAGDPGRARCSARYYVGHCKDSRLLARLCEHRDGTWIEHDIPNADPPALPKWFHENGIGFRVANVWISRGRKFERRLKRAGHYDRHDTGRDLFEMIETGQWLPLRFIPDRRKKEYLFQISITDLPF